MLNTVEIEGSQLTYWHQPLPQAGPLVMLHGLGSDHTGLLDLAARLSEVEIIVPDLPGFGRSRPLSGRHTLARYAEVVEGLRLHLGLSRFALLGHSFGADVALAYAGTYPEEVSDLCLLNPVVSIAGRTARLVVAYYQACGALPAPFGRLVLSSRAAVYVQDWASLTTRDRARRRRIRQQDYLTARSADPRATAESVLSIRDAELERYAEHLRARTLVIGGRATKWRRPPRCLGCAGAGRTFR